MLQKTQKELEDARRLSDIGTLAATVAHELRNPLGVIKTAVYNLKSKVNAPALESNFAHIDKKFQKAKRLLEICSVIQKYPCRALKNLAATKF